MTKCLSATVRERIMFELSAIAREIALLQGPLHNSDPNPLTLIRMLGRPVTLTFCWREDRTQDTLLSNRVCCSSFREPILPREPIRLSN